MASTSKSNRRKGKGRNFKFTPKPKQQWQVKQEKRNWLELPTDVTANILNRVGVFDILENAQKVCTSWRKICKDPAMWRVIHMDNAFGDPNARPPLQEMCKHAVDRSQGQVVEICIQDFADDELLLYISHRSSQLKRLQIEWCYGSIYDTWSECLERFPLLEELSLFESDISKEAIETAGRCCPLLKTLKLNQKAYRMWGRNTNADEESVRSQNEIAVAIGENLRELRHLELIGDSMTNIGLKAILDNCSNLESLDLRECIYINLEGDLGKRLSKEIKGCLKLPHDSLEGRPYIYLKEDRDNEISDVYADSDDDSDYDYDDYLDYYDSEFEYDFDDFFDEEGNGPNFEDLNDWMMFKALFD